MNAGAYGVNSDDVTLLILAVNANQPRDQQLAPKKTIVLSRSDDGSNYSSKNHKNGGWGSGAGAGGWGRRANP